MKSLDAARALFAALAALTLAACVQAPARTVPKPRPLPKVAPPNTDGFPKPSEIPPNILDTPEPVPQNEPKSQYGNPSTYEVYGESYTVLDSAVGYKETGLASWYGRKFQGKRTSSGETYDMYRLTAAHKTLPIPCYVRVTNITNGKSTIVKVNDRGPFHSTRIIDLSYTAAAKIGLLGGPAMVEVEAIIPGEILPPAPAVLKPEPATPSKPSYLQVAAYSDPINAVALREEMKKLGITNIVIVDASYDGGPIQRVLVGPFKDAASLAKTRKRLAGAGLAPIAVSK